MDYTPFIQLIIWILIGIWGWNIGKGKNRPVLGAILGFALGIIGIVIILCMGEKEPKEVKAPEPPPLPKESDQ